MTLASPRSLLFAVIALSLPWAVTGCGSCPNGQEIVIPASDGTAPSIVMEFHLPNGNTVAVTSTATPSTITVPGGGTVTVIVNAKDAEGIQDVQIWAAEITVTNNPDGTVSKAGPGLLGAPTASNPDGRTAGQKGCTERVVSQNLTVTKNSHGSTSFEVSARGINFGGTTASTPLVQLQAQ